MKKRDQGTLGQPSRGDHPPKMHKLSALRLLNEELASIEQQCQQFKALGGNAAQADLDAGLGALARTITFLEDCKVQSESLVRVLSALQAVAAGASPPAMLAPAATRHRKPDPPNIEAVKGRLAAIMEYRQQAGLDRLAARNWVARYIPSELERQLRAGKGATVDSWLAKWGGDRGATAGPGREGYLRMRAILAAHNPDEQQLKRIIEQFQTLLAS